MLHLHRLVRFDTYCSHEENLINCEDENSKYVGPIQQNPISDDKLQTVFYFSNGVELESLSYEFHKSKLSEV